MLCRNISILTCNNICWYSKAHIKKYRLRWYIAQISYRLDIILDIVLTQCGILPQGKLAADSRKNRDKTASITHLLPTIPNCVIVPSRRKTRTTIRIRFISFSPSLPLSGKKASMSAILSRGSNVRASVHIHFLASLRKGTALVGRSPPIRRTLPPSVHASLPPFSTIWVTPRRARGAWAAVLFGEINRWNTRENSTYWPRLFSVARDESDRSEWFVTLPKIATKALYLRWLKS